MSEQWKSPRARAEEVATSRREAFEAVMELVDAGELERETAMALLRLNPNEVSHVTSAAAVRDSKLGRIALLLKTIGASDLPLVSELVAQEMKVRRERDIKKREEEQ